MGGERKRLTEEERLELARKTLEDLVNNDGWPPDLLEKFSRIRFGELKRPCVPDGDILDAVLKRVLEEAEFYVDERLTGPSNNRVPLGKNRDGSQKLARR